MCNNSENRKKFYLNKTTLLYFEELGLRLDNDGGGLVVGNSLVVNYALSMLQAIEDEAGLEAERLLLRMQEANQALPAPKKVKLSFWDGIRAALGQEVYPKQVPDFGADRFMQHGLIMEERCKQFYLKEIFPPAPVELSDKAMGIVPLRLQGSQDSFIQAYEDDLADLGMGPTKAGNLLNCIWALANQSWIQGKNFEAASNNLRHRMLSHYNEDFSLEAANKMAAWMYAWSNGEEVYPGISIAGLAAHLAAVVFPVNEFTGPWDNPEFLTYLEEGHPCENHHINSNHE